VPSLRRRRITTARDLARTLQDFLDKIGARPQ
jgi:hypothetical protein